MEVGLIKPTLAVDFDGVLNTYASGYDPAYVPDPPVEGALDALTEYASAYQIVVFSTRAAEPQGIQTILDWLNRNGFGQIPLTVTSEKPAAHAYLDDRGVNFAGPGRFPTVAELQEFHPWWQTTADTYSFPPLDGATPDRAVASVVERARAADPVVTEAVRRAVEFVGGRVDGLDDRVKSGQAVAAKLAGLMAEKGIGLAAATADVKDGLRYAAVFDAEAYVPAGEALLALLEGAGLNVERIRNYWLPDAAAASRYAEGTYVGVNVVLRSANGFAFELQLHTPQSLDVQSVNWDFYRLIRSGGLEPEERERVEGQMIANNMFVPVPPRVDELASSALVADATDGVSRGIPALAHYRDATDPDVSCGTCSYFGAGTNFHCGMWDEAVAAGKVCDEWAEGLPGALPTQWQWDDLDEVEYPLLAAVDVAPTSTMVALKPHPDGDLPPLTAAAADSTFCLPDELRGVTDPVRTAFVAAVMTPALKEAGLSWDLSNPLAADAISRAGQHIVGISQTTQDDVMNAVHYAHDQGLSIPDTAKAIRSHMRDASTGRATTIARTEMAAAVNGGSLAAAKVAISAIGGTGPGTAQATKTWMTAPGATYPRHEDYPDLDGQTVALDGLFQVGDSQLKYPGDPDGDPGEVINCRCSLSYAGGSEALAGENMDAAGGRRVDWNAHNARVAAAHRRIDALEAKLVAALEPIFVRAGEVAAANFERLATDHMTAAGADDWTPPSGEEVLPVRCGAGDLPSHVSAQTTMTPPSAVDLAALAGRSSSWVATLTSEERGAVHAYTGPAYRGINATLRGVDSDLTDSQFAGQYGFSRELALDWAAEIDSALAKAPPLPPATSIYRGMDPFSGAIPDLQDAWEALPESERWDIERQRSMIRDWLTDNNEVVGAVGRPGSGGFQSYSALPGFAARWAGNQARIGILYRVVNAVQGVPVSAGAAIEREQEVLVGRHVQYRIEGVHDETVEDPVDGGGLPCVVVDLVEV